MYTVTFYEDKSGESPVADYIEELNRKASSDKNSHVKLSKIYYYISLLEAHGTRIGLPTTRYLEEDIWELRPLNDRFLYSYWKDNTFVILHHFTKKTQKTPPKELAQAKRNLKDFLERNE